MRSVLANYDAIMGVMLPTLGEERRKTYSPVLPVSQVNGTVLPVPVVGTLIGACVGAFVGSLLGDLWADYGKW